MNYEIQIIDGKEYRVYENGIGISVEESFCPYGDWAGCICDPDANVYCDDPLVF